MAKNLVGSIELSKLKHAIRVSPNSGQPYIAIPLDQDGIFQPEESSKVYLNIACFVADVDDQYGKRANVTVGQSKEERESGKPKVYLGNLKQIWEGEANSQNQNNNNQNSGSAKPHIGNDDLPF